MPFSVGTLLLYVAATNLTLTSETSKVWVCYSI